MIDDIKEMYKVENIDDVYKKLYEKIKKEQKLDEIIEIIEKNPELLEKISTDKLEIIDNYYTEKISKLEKMSE